MELFYIYLLAILPNLKDIFGWVIFFTVVFIVIYSILTIAISDDIGEFKINAKNNRKYFGYAGLLLCLNIISFNLVPTTQQLIFIVSAYYVTNIENVDKVPENMVSAFNSLLKEFEETTPKAE